MVVSAVDILDAVLKVAVRRKGFLVHVSCTPRLKKTQIDNTITNTCMMVYDGRTDPRFFTVMDVHVSL